MGCKKKKCNHLLLEKCNINSFHCLAPFHLINTTIVDTIEATNSILAQKNDRQIFRNSLKTMHEKYIC